MMKTKTNLKLLLSFLFVAIAVLGAIAQDKGHRHGEHGQRKHGDRLHKASWVERAYHATEADSVQKRKMKPILEKATKRLEALRASYEKQENHVIDSLSVQLKPLLKEDQLKKWNEWRDRKKEKTK